MQIRPPAVDKSNLESPASVGSPQAKYQHAETLDQKLHSAVRHEGKQNSHICSALVALYLKAAKLRSRLQHQHRPQSLSFFFRHVGPSNRAFRTALLLYQLDPRRLCYELYISLRNAKPSGLHSC